MKYLVWSLCMFTVWPSASKITVVWGIFVFAFIASLLVMGGHSNYWLEIQCWFWYGRKVSDTYSRSWEIISIIFKNTLVDFIIFHWTWYFQVEIRKQCLIFLKVQMKHLIFFMKSSRRTESIEAFVFCQK